MKTKKDPNAKRRIGIVGSVISGKSFSGYFGKYTGSESVLEQIGNSGDIEVYINSQGGSVFAGFEILNSLKAAVVAGRKVDIYISPLAASIASYIGVGVKGANVYGSENAKLMFHAPWSCACGSKDQLRDYADLLAKMEDDLKDAVASRGVTAEDDWFAAGRMKWFSAKESLELKLIDEIKEPPAELISAVSASGTNGSYDDDDDMYDSADQNNTERSMLRIAANMEFTGYLESLAQEHFGEDKIKMVKDISATTFELIFQDGSKSLLNYTKDPLNIVNIEWESNPKQTMENQMKDPKNPVKDVVTPGNDAGTVADPANGGDDGAFIEGVTPTNSTPVVIKPEATVVNTPVAEKGALPAGMTEDMVAFAKKSYETTKNTYIATIKANKENQFSDEELNDLPMATIEKMANLAKPATPVAGEPAAPKADVTIVKVNDKKDTGNVGTLPPPEL